MSGDQDRLDVVPISLFEPGDDDEIAKNEIYLNHDENPPFVAATFVSEESTTIVDDAEPVHEMAIAQILDEDEHTNTTSSSTSRTLSEPATTQRSPFLTQRESSLTSYTDNDVLSRQESFQVAQEIVHIDAADEVPCDQPSIAQHDHDVNEEERKFDRLQRYCKIYIAVAFVMFVVGTVGIILVALNLGPFPAHSPAITDPASQLYPTLAPFNIHATPAEPWISSSPSDMPNDVF